MIPKPAITTIYSLAGLRIVSELPLPGLTISNGKIEVGNEIVIRRARVPTSLSVVHKSFPDGQCNETELLLDVPAVARYLLRGGNEIIVDDNGASSYGDVCAYLLGTVFGALCHQRGIVPLHASVINVSEGCVAFVGESGAGKSTLAAALAACGHQVIADDVCFLRVGVKDLRAWPGVNRIRLWEDAIAALGCEGPGIERELRGYNKYLIPIHPSPCPTESRNLRRVYQLRAMSNGVNPNIQPLHGAAVIEILMQNVYRLELAEYMGQKPAAFRVCAAVARNVPVFRFNRPMGFDVLQQGIDFLEAHLRDIR